MSLTKRFNPTPTPATEDIKEDLTGNVATDTVETVITPTEAAEPVVAEVPVEQTPVTTEPVDVVTTTDIVTTDVTDTVATTVEPEEVATTIEPNTPAEPVDTPAKSVEEKTTKTPIDTSVIEVHEESAAHSDVEVVENKVSDQTVVEVETETEEDEGEEVEFLQTEITAGLEAICELENLASKLGKQETLGVAQEAYGDLALMVFNKIKTNLGLEDSSEEPVNSNKVKDFKDKVIAGIKALWEKIKEILKSIFKKFTDFLDLIKRKYELAIENLKAVKEEIVDGKKEYVIIPVKKHFLTEDVVTTEHAISSEYLNYQEHNYKKFSNYIEAIRTIIANLENDANDDNELEELGKDLIDSLHASDDVMFADSKFRRISNDYYVGCLGKKVILLSINSVAKDKIKIGEQKLEKPTGKRVDELMVSLKELQKKSDKILSEHAELNSDITKVVDFEIPRLLNGIKNKTFKDFNDLNKGKKDTDKLNQCMLALSSVGMVLYNYTKQILDNPAYYLEEAVNKK